MKTSLSLRSILLLTAAAKLVTATASAATLYWDGNDTSANADGGAGTWDNLTTANWDTMRLGGLNSTWNNSNPDFAIFGGTASTVTLGGNITVAGLRFDTTGYTINTGSNTLSFGATNSFIGFSRAAAATITGAVGGTGNVAVGYVNPMVGGALTPFTLTLNGTSTGGWSGSTTIGALSTLNLSQSSQALLNTSSINLNGGGMTLTNTTAGEGLLDRVSNGTPIISNGGSITFTNTSSASSYVEVLGILQLDSGKTNIVLSNNQTGGGIQSLNISLLSRGGSSTTTFSAAGAGPNSTTNIIAIPTAMGTPAGQVLGAWATTGNGPNAQSDYAIINGSSQVVPANIAGSAETTWTTATNAYTLNTGSAVTLTGTRTIDALRFIGAASTLNVDTGADLQTRGLLFGGVNAKTVASLGTGVLTTPGGGGFLYLTSGQTPGSGNHTISAVIANNGGTVSPVISGPARLVLTGTNTFSGSVILNGGTLTVSSDGNLGATGVGAAPIVVNNTSILTPGSATYNRGIQINNGSILQFDGGGANFTGNITGNGGVGNLSNFGSQVNLSGTANTFEGPVLIGAGGATGQAYRFQFGSLADSAIANGRIVFTASSVTHGDGSVFQYNGGTNLTLDHRVIEIASTGATPSNGHQIRSSGTGTLTINTDLLVTSTTAQTVRLGGTNTGDNIFAGDITNGSSSAISLTKADAGKWILSGTNTYTGTTINAFSNPAGGGLIFRGVQALSPNTTFQQTHAGGVGGFGTIRILDDSAIPSSRSGVNLNMLASNTNHTMTLFVGNNNTANGGSSSGTTTGSTIQLGNLNFTQNATGNTSQTLAVTGANGYKLQIGAVNLPTTTGNWNGILNPTTASLSVSGNVQQLAGSTAGAMTLTLDGTATGNLISGNILDSADGTPRALALVKTNTAGAWTLTGANAYTGNTTISGGTLEIGGGGTLGHVSPGVGSYAGAISIASTNSGRLVYDSSSSQTLGGVISGAGALFVENGTLDLGNTNSYTGATAVNGGTLLVNGSTAAGSAVSVASGATLGGVGEVNGTLNVTGSIAPGNNDISTLTVNNNVTWNGASTAGSATDWKFALGSGDTADLLFIDGDFTKNSGAGSNFRFDFLGSTDLGTFELISWTGTTDFVDTDFSQFNYAGAVAGSFSISSNTLYFTAVPEPTSALAGILLGAGLLRRRRRHTNA